MGALAAICGEEKEMSKVETVDVVEEIAMFNRYRVQHGWAPVCNEAEMKAAKEDIKKYKQDPSSHLRERGIICNSKKRR